MAEYALITFVLPYYNEAGFIAATLASLAAQTDRRFRLVLVDNASDDGSEVVAREACGAMPDITVTFLHEARPGKIHALRAGLGQVSTPLVGTIDADTIYPPGYVAQALAMFASNPAASCALAFGISPGTGHAGQRALLRLYARLFLERAGGFDAARWPHVLEDHEIVHRVRIFGPILYGADFECHPSDRRDDRSRCSWTLGERVIYKLLPTPFMDWFFYRFLGPGLERRGLGNLRLREKSWGQ